MITARFVRTAAAASLVLNAVLSIVAITLMPAFAQSSADYLSAIDTAGASAAVSAAAFVVAQLPFIIAMLGISHLVGTRAPILSIIGGTIAVIGGFGHAVLGGAQLSQLAMAGDSANRETYAALLDAGMPLPLMILMMCGTIGTVLGLLLLAVGLLRAKVGPRWVPYAIWLWLVVEFVGTNITEWATLASGLLYLGAFGALAATIWRSPVAVWASAATSGVDVARADAQTTSDR